MDESWTCQIIIIAYVKNFAELPSMSEDKRSSKFLSFCMLLY